MTVHELKTILEQAGPKPVLLDVREAWELRICALPDVIHIPMGQIPARIDELDRDSETVVLCHHGIRSQRVCYLLQGAGFRNLHNLRGGIDAWAREVDPGMPTY